jgi:putative sterol carrier protein
MEPLMSKVIDAAIAALSAKLGTGYDGVAKFVLLGEGAIICDASGVRAGDDPADVTLTASTEVFQALLAGEISATSAYMSGKLALDGPLTLAMKLGQALR